MSEKIDNLNAIYSQVETRIRGSLHSTLWQIMVNDSLEGSEAAFVDMPTRPSIGIAVIGGYLSANFDVIGASDVDDVINLLNREVFGLSPDEAMKVVGRSMR